MALPSASPVPGVAPGGRCGLHPAALGPRGKGIFGGAVPGGRSRGWGDRAAALGHYTIPLKRDMKPTGVGRNLQICGDPGLCSLAVNMIYSKPFPDGTIKTRGSGFASVSWSHWGAGRRGGGSVARAARASGTSCRGQPPPATPAPSRAPARPGDARRRRCPGHGQHTRACSVQGNAPEQPRLQASSGPAWKQQCVRANEWR